MKLFLLALFVMYVKGYELIVNNTNANVVYQYSTLVFATIKNLLNYNFVNGSTYNPIVSNIVANFQGSEISGLTYLAINYGVFNSIFIGIFVITFLLMLLTSVCWMFVQCFKISCGCCQNENQCCSCCCFDFRTNQPRKCCLVFSRLVYLVMVIGVLFGTILVVYNEFNYLEPITTLNTNIQDTYQIISDIIGGKHLGYMYANISANLDYVRNMSRDVLEMYNSAIFTAGRTSEFETLVWVSGNGTLFVNDLSESIIGPMQIQKQQFDGYYTTAMGYYQSVMNYGIAKMVVVIVILVLLALLIVCGLINTVFVKSRCCTHGMMCAIMLFGTIISLISVVFIVVSIPMYDASTIIYNNETYDNLLNLTESMNLTIIGNTTVYDMTKYYLNCQGSNPFNILIWDGLVSLSNIYDNLNVTILQDYDPIIYQNVTDAIEVTNREIGYIMDNLTVEFNCANVNEKAGMLLHSIFVKVRDVVIMYTLSFGLLSFCMVIVFWVNICYKGYWTYKQSIKQTLTAMEELHKKNDGDLPVLPNAPPIIRESVPLKPQPASPTVLRHAPEPQIPPTYTYAVIPQQPVFQPIPANTSPYQQNPYGTGYINYSTGQPEYQFVAQPTYTQQTNLPIVGLPVVSDKPTNQSS